MAKRKYASLSTLQNFLDNLKTTFASITHKHTVADLSDYEVDTALSSTSTNSVQNKVVDAEFEAIATAMNALEAAVDEKSDASHTHAITDIANLQSELDSKAVNSHSHVVADIADLTATATELSYLSGTTSSVQTQLDALATDITNRLPLNNDGYTPITSTSDLDLDNYKTVGIYTCVAAIGKTLVNSPVSTGLKMIVMQGYSNDRRHQFIFGASTNSVYHRMYNGSVWSAWANLSKTTLEELGITATATELNKLTDVTVTTEELNYLSGVSSNIQTQLNDKADSSHGTHVTYSATAPLMDGSASIGTASTVSRSDHRHPTDTSRASQIDLDALEDVVSGKADLSHDHDDRYYTESETDILLSDIQTQINGFVDWFKAGTSIPSSSDINTYTTTGKYYVGSGDIAETLINSPTNSDNYVLYVFKRTSGSANSASITQMAITLNGGLYLRGTNATGSFRAWKRKADYGELETMSTQLTEAINSKANSNHNHDENYDLIGSANDALEAAKAYTDDEILSAISTAADDATIKANNALDSAKAYADTVATDAAKVVKNDLLNGAGEAYDTLKELGELIDENTDAIEALETVAAKKANVSHTHTVADITDLTATAAELNYMDGVTSSVQSQLDAISAGLSKRIPYDNTGYIVLASGTDLNTVTTAGMYTAVSSVGKTLVNSPITTGQKLIVIEGYGGGRIHQFILGASTNRIYYRMQNGNADTSLGWTDWVNLSVSQLSDLGITVTADELNYTGGLTGNIQYQLDGLSTLVGDTPISEQISTALQDAKDSGEFDGKDGEDGYTPVKGTDYWTQDDMNEILTYIDEAMVDFYEKGEALPSGADLDTYTTLGKYYATNGNIAASLSNCPTTANFVLYVFARTTASTPSQLIISLSGRLYIRSRSSSAWRDWQTFVTTMDLESYATVTALEGKSDVSHTHTVSDITDLAASATEIGYLSGVTSNVQAQLDGKAASGHTHSSYASTTATTITDMNDNTLPTGWYRLDVTTTNKPSRINYANVEIINYNKECVQIVHSVLDGSIIRRINIGDTFGEWEWVNPPMLTDVEYRTTERWNSSPVYKKYDSASSEILWSTDGSTWKTEFCDVLNGDMYGENLPSAGIVGRIFFKKA